MTENGENASLDNNFSDKQFHTMKNNMIKSDPKVFTENGFWEEELEMLLGNKEDYLNGK